MKAKLTGLLVGATVLVSASTAMAVGYASGVTKVGDDVSFILNQNAAVVQAILDGGAQTLNLSTTAGQVSFNMAGYSTFQIKVSSYGGGTGWNQFIPNGTDRNFEYPFGVSINNNPASADFGKVYVSQSRDGTTAAGRFTQSGIYVLRADGVALGGVKTGGVDWTAAGNSAPFKSTIGPDGHLYVADFSNDRAYEFNNDLSVATRVIDDSNKTTGQYVESIWVEGTQAAGNRRIYTVDSDYYGGAAGRKGLIRYDLNGNATATPGDTGTQVIGPTYFTYYPRDVARDSAGNWYMNNYRATAGQAPAVVKFHDSSTLPINTAEWESSSAPTYTYGLGLNEAGGTVATASASNGTVWFFDMATGALVESFDAGTAVRDLAFDAAGNLVTVDNSVEYAKFWSPGGWWETYYGSDGSFAVVVPEPTTLSLLGLGGLVLLLRRRR